MSSIHESPPAPAPDPAPDDTTPSLPSPETRKERYARHGHRVGLYAGAVVFVALLSGLIVLISVNTRRVTLSWPFGSTHASLVWIILAAAVIGWLLGITTAVVFHHRTRRP